jgi:hypothetical protein
MKSIENLKLLIENLENQTIQPKALHNVISSLPFLINDFLKILPAKF